jgi:hypothetical protein
MRSIHLFAGLGFLISFSLQPVYGSGPPWKFSTNQGNTSITFGFLAQPQFESLENPSGEGSLNNLFLRRFRLIAGGKITSKLSYFVESDAANLGKKAANGERTTEFYLQDAYVNYAFRPEFQLDGGMLLLPLSHNTGQSAATLLPVDYGPYSFLASDPTRSKVGRDYGLQARGYLKSHFEYRLGVYRGNRNHDGDFPYRYTARFVWYPLEADTGFFYTGTTHGQKKILGIGASYDGQGDYRTKSLDVFLDYPLPNGDAVTVQADFMRLDGGTSFKTLPKQNAWLLEGSYYNKKSRLGPFIQFASRDFTNPDSLDDMKVQGGIAYWILKHRLNIKAGFGRLLKDESPDRTQIVLQTQLFYY